MPIQQETGGGHSRPFKDETLQGTGSGRKRCMEPRRCEAAHCLTYQQEETWAAEVVQSLSTSLGQPGTVQRGPCMAATACGGDLSRAALRYFAALQVD